VIFLGLGFWCKKQPLGAIISALILYIMVQLIAIIQNPLNIISGIIVKVIIIIYLIKGMNSALQAQKIKKELNL